ncbi:MAG: hypothetical protein ABSA07_08045 [Acidimicrobiales bacterium]
MIRSEQTRFVIWTAPNLAAPESIEDTEISVRVDRRASASVSLNDVARGPHVSSAAFGDVFLSRARISCGSATIGGRR